MSAKRSGARMARLSERLFAGMAERGITGAVAQEIVDKLAAFANFGFPESHAVSFAYLVYSSAWLKLHYPAAFCAGLLNAQPMGFWSPQSLVADARRHGVTVRRPHVDVSGVGATLEWGLDEPGAVVGVAPRGRRSPTRRAVGAHLGARDRRGRGASASARAVPTRRWRTWCAGPGRVGPSSRRSPPPAPSRGWPPRDGAPEMRGQAPDAVGGRRARPRHRGPTAGARVGGRRPTASRPHPARGGGGRHVGHRPHRRDDARWSSPGPASTPWG